jgi:murein L,D-transpeptidase YcbB/YkuD
MFVRFLVLLLFAVPLAHGAGSGNIDPSSSTLSAALRAADRSPLSGRVVAHEADILRSVYARQGEHLLWSEGPRPSRQAAELLDILRSADTYGLRPSDYGADLIATAANRLAGQEAAEPWAQWDLMLSRAAIRLIVHLHFGRIDPRTAGFELKESRADLDVAATVAALASASRVSDAVAAVEPRFYHYTLLKAALTRYRALAADPSLTQLPSFGPRTLHVGDAYAGAAALGTLLAALGDLAPSETPATATDHTLDARLSAGLKRFQDRHGLPSDGALGTQTFVALTTPLAQRVRQIELTLERWRWLPPFATPPIIVNIPQFRLFAFRTTEDRFADIMQMPVIVGQTYPRTQTPVFMGQMKYVIFRPYWDVPRSITVREMLPKIRADTDYLQRNDLEIVRGQSDDAVVMSPSPATIAALAAGQLRLRQRPGDDNALGLIKFVFPNVHDVYLHSTPARQLFLQSRRAFSHGCIRVSDPTALAAYVLRDSPGGWDADKISAAMHASDSSRIDLRQPIEVMILYGTALATEAGPIEFFEDIYGHDRKLEGLLGLQPVHAPEPPARL